MKQKKEPKKEAKNGRHQRGMVGSDGAKRRLIFAAAPTSPTGGRTATRTATTTTSSGERRPVDGGPVCVQTVRTSIKTEARDALVRDAERGTKVHGRAGHALS